MNLPTKLTMLRIILVPIFIVVLLSRFKGTYSVIAQYLALSIFILAAITDGLDGYIARKQGQTTRLGKLLDPLADKILISAALIALVDMGKITSWPAIIIIAREFSVTGLRMLAVSEGKIITASFMGKVKTISQITAISAVIIGLPFSQALLWTAVFLTILSGITYFHRWRTIIDSSDGKPLP